LRIKNWGQIVLNFYFPVKRVHKLFIKATTYYFLPGRALRSIEKYIKVNSVSPAGDKHEFEGISSRYLFLDVYPLPGKPVFQKFPFY
jgi:hypothetical protein